MMRNMRFVAIVALLVAMSSCSADSAEGSESPATAEAVVANYNYNDSEIESMKLINDYRVSIGLNALKGINHVSFKCEEHNKYMIANNVVDHNDFTSRSNNIMSVLGAKKVGENVAYNYKTSEAALRAWLDSPGHKANIEGDYTHFGLSVSIDPNTGKKYYTNIFVKM